MPKKKPIKLFWEKDQDVIQLKSMTKNYEKDYATGLEKKWQ